MPYKLSQKGVRLLVNAETLKLPLKSLGLTDLQKKALTYLRENEGFVESSTIARFYGLAPQAMRGPCWRLYLQGLLEVKEV